METGCLNNSSQQCSLAMFLRNLRQEFSHLKITLNYFKIRACMIQYIPITIATNEDAKERFRGRFSLLNAFPRRKEPSPKAPAVMLIAPIVPGK